MKHLFLTISVIFITLSALAQTSDKLDFDSPRFLPDDYFEVVKAHLGPEGRKEWKPEFTLRENVMLLDLSTNLTAGIRTSPNKVFGLGVGLGQSYYKVASTSLRAERLSGLLYHRHYIPLGHRKRWTMYSDLMIGARYIYEMEDWYLQNGIQRGNDSEPYFPIMPGDWQWWVSWQPGIAFSMWGKSNLFLGLSIGPTIGFHAGIAL